MRKKPAKGEKTNSVILLTSNLTRRRFHRTMEIIPAFPWWSKNLSVSTSIKQSSNKGTQRVQARHVQFHCPAARSSNHIGHGFRENLNTYGGSQVKFSEKVGQKSFLENRACSGVAGAFSAPIKALLEPIGIPPHLRAMHEEKEDITLKGAFWAWSQAPFRLPQSLCNRNKFERMYLRNRNYFVRLSLCLCFFAQSLFRKSNGSADARVLFALMFYSIFITGHITQNLPFADESGGSTPCSNSALRSSSGRAGTIVDLVRSSAHR